MYQTILKSLFVAAGLMPVIGWSHNSPAGWWQTMDEATGKPASVVRIDEADGVFSGAIDHIHDPDKAALKCAACVDERKDQPLLGLTIMRGVKLSSTEPPTWEGGDILDPKNGNTYKVRLRVINDGKTLEVRGYKGSPMFGRTQLWERVESTVTPTAASSASQDALVGSTSAPLP